MNLPFCRIQRDTARFMDIFIHQDGAPDTVARTDADMLHFRIGKVNIAGNPIDG